ncbi:MAG: 7-cyano-7-deazaguanine synthase QueC [Rhodospirillales bacterium CG15_BIG_FIL_POST_REV_8_21_14_020_66_15]|nr:MAG: 7-cyano-7-deazaguanine synthase QueC [Rhodospirillales bacterium CG15_BIG_FIL_POST_REV_8_21_14_020_66_15]
MALGETAVVLLSGGLDSATACAIARDRGFRVLALSFRYGQRHAVELDSARRVAKRMGVARHAIAEIDLTLYGGSALTDDIAVPKDRAAAAMADGIPVTYVPARNTIFLAHALALAETGGARHIFIGVNVLDYSGYPDCRPAFIKAFQRLANLATREGVEAMARGAEGPFHVEAPLMDMTKAEIIHTGHGLGVDYAMTWSCYDPQPGPGDAAAPVHCGHCDSCQLRKKGFAEAGIKDPTVYAD